MSNNSDLQHAVMALLKTAGDLSDAQALLDATPDLTTAPRDHASRKVCDAFRAFESGAKAAKKPLRITIRLTPSDSATKS
jgi:alkylhydroperoxidase family enzyme